MDGVSIWHWVIVMAVVMPIGFLPSIIAFARGHVQKWLVFVLNLLLGWTGIVWVGVLIWAIAGRPVAVKEAT